VLPVFFHGFTLDASAETKVSRRSHRANEDEECAWQNLAADARKFTSADEMAGIASWLMDPSRGYSGFDLERCPLKLLRNE
jgi:hypothetical protein